MGNVARSLESLTNRARAGKTVSKLSIYKDEVVILEKMGFNVKVPKRLREAHGKSRIEVTISWDNPARINQRANDLFQMVRRYRNRKNKRNITETKRLVKLSRILVSGYERGFAVSGEDGKFIEMISG